MTLRKLSVFSAVALVLAGCAATADTFPLNEQAKAMGPLRIGFTRTGLGFAPVTATLGDGEVLHGTVHPAFNEALGRASALALMALEARQRLACPVATLGSFLPGPKRSFYAEGP